jgi:hypothetical protein
VIEANDVFTLMLMDGTLAKYKTSLLLQTKNTNCGGSARYIGIIQL